LLTGSHAGVITLGNDVGQAVVDDELDLDVRIVPQEFHKFRPKDCFDGILGGRDAGGAGGFLAKFT